MKNDELRRSKAGGLPEPADVGAGPGHIPDARECALLLLLLIKTGEEEVGRPISRFRVAELTLRRMWGRRRITPDLVEDVNDWLARANRVLFLAGSSYGVVLVSAIESWSRISSKRIQAETNAVLAGTFDFSVLEPLLAPAENDGDEA